MATGVKYGFTLVEFLIRRIGIYLKASRVVQKSIVVLSPSHPP